MIKQWDIFKYFEIYDPIYYPPQYLNSYETVIWFDYVCTCMFRRPLRAENPWWDIDDASIWSSSTRWDSMPRGGHSEGPETLSHSFLKALKSYDKSTDSFLWADVFQTLNISHFLQRKIICAEQSLKLKPTAVLVQKARNSSWKPKSLWGKNMSALAFTALSSEFAHWTHNHFCIYKYPLP